MRTLVIVFFIILSLNSYCQNCTITIVNPAIDLVEFAIKWRDTTLYSNNGKVTVDSTMRYEIGVEKLRIMFTNGMDKKLYLLPEKLRSPFNLTGLVCGLHILTRRQIR